jgi:hypothetical protein
MKEGEDMSHQRKRKRKNRRVDPELASAVRKAMDELFEGLEQMPTITVETEDGQDLSEKPVRDVADWLFQRRDEDGTE